MNKLWLVLPAVAVLAGCQTGSYELETPTSDITVNLWTGVSKMNDIIQIENGELQEVKVIVNKAHKDDWVDDNSGLSGFRINDLKGETQVSFKCTRSKPNEYSEKEECTRFEVDMSNIAEIPVGTEYRK